MAATACLVLHPDPELVHLSKVEEDKLDAVLNVSRVLSLLQKHRLQSQCTSMGTMIRGPKKFS